MKDYIDVVSGFISDDAGIIEEATSKPVSNSVKVKGKAKKAKGKVSGALKVVKGIKRDDIGFILLILLLLSIPLMLLLLCYDGYCRLSDYADVMEKHPGLDDAISNYYITLNKKNGEDGIESGYLSTKDVIITKDIENENTMLVGVYDLQKVNKNSGVVTEQEWKGKWQCINGTWKPINFKMVSAQVADPNDG